MNDKYIFFDFANTLASIYPPLEKNIQNFLKSKKIFRSKKKIKQSILCANEVFFFSSFAKNKKYKELFYLKNNSFILKRLGIYNKFETEMYDYILNSNKFWVLKKNVFLTLKKLRIDHNLGIISNFDKNLVNILNNLKIGKFFNLIIVSDIEGVEKQNKTFYKKIIKKYKINLDKSIFVGDNYHLDYLNSKNSGLNTFLITENEKLFSKKNLKNKIIKNFNKKNIIRLFDTLQN